MRIILQQTNYLSEVEFRIQKNLLLEW